MSKVFSHLRSTEGRINATLKYFDLFNAALTKEQLAENCLGKKPSLSEIEYKETFPKNFKEKQKLIQEYWHKVDRYRWLFSISPFVEFVAICNSLPLGDVSDDSDIDVFVVAKPSHLFMARTFLTLLTTIIGVRRHGKHIKKRFCLSFYVTSNHLNLESIALKPADIYLAYWIKTLQPITGDFKSYERFLETNREWLKPYFHHIQKQREHFRNSGLLARTLKSFLEKMLGSQWLERRLQGIQLKRAHNKQSRLKDPSGTLLSKDILKFHDEDRRKEIQEAWESSLSTRR